MTDQLLSGNALLMALEETKVGRFPELPDKLRLSIVQNVPAEARLKGLEEVKKHLRAEVAGAKAAETISQTNGAHSSK